MVRTRFAPSPTGYLHIGGVRTALFNWLFARKHGGQFILRIDDTDQKRNLDEALQPILDGFKWLGMDWDEGPEVGGPHAPYFQSQRGEAYQAAVDKLLADGHAYYDYSEGDHQAESEAAQQNKVAFVYSRKWMAESDEQRAEFEAEGRQGVVRLRMRREGTLVLNDLVRGEVRFAWDQQQDAIIQRADGTFIYHLASVVDDHDFEITHVIRAEEHLSNTPRQIFIAESLGFTPPKYAHVPFVAEPGSKKKLSKRNLDKYLKNRDFAKLNQLGQDTAAAIGLETSAETFNPVIVDFYEQVGFLPDAMINYLVLLGWSLDGETEFFTRDQMIENFSLERINKAAASFDPQKLTAFQQHYMNQLPTKQKVAKVLPYLQQAGFVSSPPPCETSLQLTPIVEAAGDRLTVSGDILRFDDFFVDDNKLAYDQKAFDKRLTKATESIELLQGFRELLPSVDPFDAANLESSLKSYLEQKDAKIGQIIHALRVAVSGKAVGFGMFETLEILGRERCLTRIDRALQQVVK